MKHLLTLSVAVVFSCGMILGQVRILPHLTTDDAFSTQIWVHNASLMSQNAQLVGMTMAGVANTPFLVELGPGETKVLEPEPSLGPDAAYVLIQAPLSVSVDARFRGSVPDSGWAHVRDSHNLSPAWQFYGGNPVQTWDGFAVVNMGDGSTQVVLRQLDLQGNQIDSAVVNEALLPGEKGLFVLADHLDPGEQAVYRVSADQPLALVGVRGDQGREFLWENHARPVQRTLEEVSLELVSAFPNLNFNQPVDFQVPGDGTGRVFIVELGGVIKVIHRQGQQPTSSVFLDLRDRVSAGGEMGLLGLALHPDFALNGVFWVNYTTLHQGPRRTVLARFHVDPQNQDQGDTTSETVVLEVNQHQPNHNGGQLAFGPDGYLYMGLGDGGGAGDPQGFGQNRGSLLGSILRLDVPIGEMGYGIPEDNPFVGNTMGWREEIYAFGLRNPWRFSFDGDRLWVADVGQNNIEEINLVGSGANCGWNRLEGSHCYPPGSACSTMGTTLPIFEYNHTNGDRSITGGYVYRGTAIPELEGAYIYGDFVSGRVWALQYEEGGVTRNRLLTRLQPQSIAAFGRDIDGEVYLCSFDGGIYRWSYAE